MTTNQRMTLNALAVRGLAALLLTSCGASQPKASLPVTTPRSAESSDNPLLRPWSGPYGGVPAFADVHIEDFAPGLAEAMAQARREIAAITSNPEAPTFENTCEAFEDTGRTLRRASTYYYIWESTLTTPAFQAIEREQAPKLAAFADEITQNTELFRRIERVYNDTRAPRPGLTPEQQRLAWRKYTDFVLAGAKVDVADKPRLLAINQRLASLYTDFGQNVLSDEESYFVALQSEADLAGLPPSVRAGAAAAAKERRLAGQWAITNTRSSVEPFLTFSSRRDLREKVWRNFVNRGDNGDAHDNNAIVAEILRLRAERAKLLGYPTHAHLRLQDTMAKTPEAALALMEAVWKPAVARVERRGRRHAGDRRRGRRADRTLGLPLLRREGTQGQVRPRPERDQAVPAARQPARRDVLGRRATGRAQLP